MISATYRGFLTVAFTLLLLVTTAHADSNVIRVGGESNLPVSSISTDGKPRGVFPEVFEDIAREEGWEVEYVPCVWDKCVDDLSNGRLDLLLATAYSPRRAEVFDFTNGSLISNWGCVYVPRNKNFDSILQLDGKRIALVRNDIHAIAFRNLLAGFGKRATYVEVDTLEDVLKSIDHGEVDAGIVNRLYGQNRINRYRVDATPIVFNPTEIRFAAPKGKQRELLATLDEHIARQKHDPASSYARAIDRWLNIGPPDPPMPKWLLPAIGAAIMSALLLIAGILLLRFEVRRKTLALTKAKEEAESLQRLYGATFDNTFQLQGLLTPDGTVLNVNKTSLELIGVESESVVGRLFWDTPWWAHDPVERQRVKEAVRRCAGGESLHFETSHLDTRGNLIHVDFSLKPLRDGSGAIIYLIPEGRDISEYKKVQQDLQIRKQELQSLFMAAPVGIAYIKNRTFVRINDALCDLYGYAHDELIGRSTRILYDSDERFEATATECYPAAVAQGSVMTEARTVDKNGEEIDVLLGLAPLVHGDESAGFVAILLDVTERKKAESALRESELRFQTIFDESPMIMTLYDVHTGSYADVNKCCCEVHGITRDVIGMRPDEAGVITRDEFLRVFEIYSREGYLDQMEIKAFGQGGSDISLLFSARTIELSGKQYVIGVSEDITARIVAENRLRESEANFRNIFENAPIGIFRSVPGGRFLAVNGIYADIFGYSSPAQMIEEVTDIPHQLYVDPEQRSRILKRCESENSVTTNDVQVRQRDGAVIYVDLYMRAIRGTDGAIEQVEGFLVDVTERKKSEIALRKSEERFQAIFDESPLIITLSELADGKFVDVNKSFCEVHGIQREFALGRTPEELGLLTRQESQMLLNLLAAEGKVDPVEMESAGANRVGLLSSRVIEVVGKPYALSMVQDITERKKAEEALIHSEKMTMIAGMAAGIAHEVNNPLSIISQHLQNLERRFSPSLAANQKVADELGLDLGALRQYMERREIVDYLSSMLKAVKRASDIISNMLQFSRQNDASHQPFGLNDVIEQSVRLASNDYDLRKKYDFKNITIIREFDEQLPPSWLCVTEMEQVFINLMKNSAQAMFEARTVKPTIVLRTFAADGFVVASVRDNGPGMDKEVLKHIFNPFYTTKDVGAGTGLGLSVSYSIVTKNHNGLLDVESERGQGACFTIRLPLGTKG